MGIHALFVDPVDDELQCPICHLVMDKPVSHCSQGHTYCQSCINACTYSGKGIGRGEEGWGVILKGRKRGYYLFPFLASFPTH